MRKYKLRMSTAIWILLLISLTISLSGCVESPAPVESPKPESTTDFGHTFRKLNPIVYGYVTTITLDKKGTELIEFDDKYDKYEIEENVGTLKTNGLIYKTHRVSLWRGDIKRVINDVTGCRLIKTTDRTRHDPYLYGYITTISFDKERTELIELDDKYDKYEIEENVGTFESNGLIYKTHRVSLWRGGIKRVVNDVIECQIRYITVEKQ